MEKVSIIIPCHNSAEFIQYTIDSLIAQSYKDCEFVFVNDGSNDETPNIINFNKKKDSRIVLVNKNNGGVSSARNAGVRVATGDYIVFCDSDDILFEDSIEILVEAIVKTATDVCFGTYFTFEKEPPHSFIRDDYKIELMDKVSMQKELSLCNKLQNHLWGKIFKSNLIKNYVFNENYFIWEDVRELYKIIELCKSGAFIETPVVMYRLSSNSLSKQVSKQILNEFCQAQIEKANFYLSNYPKIAKYHSESMFQCGAEILSNRLKNDVELFTEFLSTYKRIVKRAGLKSYLKYLIIRNKKLYRIVFRKK